MKNVKTPFILRKRFVTAISIGFGAIMGGLLSAIGQNSGVYRGIEEADERWRSAVDEVLEQEQQERDRNKTEEEEKEK